MIKKILIPCISFIAFLSFGEKKCKIGGISATIDDSGRVTNFHPDGTVSYSREYKQKSIYQYRVRQDNPLYLDLHLRQKEIDKVTQNYRYRVNAEKFKSYSHARKRIQYYEKEAEKAGVSLHIEKLKHNKGFIISGHESLPMPEPYIKTKYDDIIKNKQSHDN